MNTSAAFQTLERTALVHNNGRLLILYATATGNAERLARQIAFEARRHGFNPHVMDMADCAPGILTEQRAALIVASTFGDGEPPEDAEPFWKALVHGNGLDLTGLQFSVLALGNTTYDHFCRCGRELDAALERHGAMRVFPRVDCDVDFDVPVRYWIGGVLETLKLQFLDVAPLYPNSSSNREDDVEQLSTNRPQ